ncbi:MAG: alanyl-tRNA editing protein [Gammaproteobacteria bacterium]|nr:alanyl-tRNA editing protein [Gammaproteobacteria bacterium]
MTKELFREDSYLRSCAATVTLVEDNTVCVDQTVFYPLGGGQPGDSGNLVWGSTSAQIVDTRYSDVGIRHVLDDGAEVPAVGTKVELTLDWDRRYKHMRMHTAMHLLGSVLQYGVTGGNITDVKSRLDFDMEDTVDKEAVSRALGELVSANHPISCRWISEAELDDNPELVRTMSVQPPRGRGDIRLLEITGVDLQPCGGTHVASTAEVGAVRVGKVEKKGRQNRRVNIHLDD